MFHVAVIIVTNSKNPGLAIASVDAVATAVSLIERCSKSLLKVCLRRSKSCTAVASSLSGSGKHSQTV